MPSEAERRLIAMFSDLAVEMEKHSNEAARARDEAAKRYRGEFAVLNFPEGAKRT